MSEEELLSKEIVSSVAIVLTFIAFIPYIRSIRQGTCKPHVVSWAVWGSSAFVVFLAQLADKGGAGAWPIGVSGIISLYIAVLAVHAAKKTSDCSVTKVDAVILVVAIGALPFWYVTSNPLWAVLILTTIDVAGFGPTFRKAYTHPHEEPVLFYLILVARNLLVLIALEHYSYTTVVFPAVVAVVCIVFVTMVVCRRRQQPNTTLL